ncbi:RHS repeat protein [Ramlibacter terrae]|uniref:RHS repeat protein n=1 Tax=Ramlibacter terrae TaxID=2732511 RepID=A0ABX6P084_9BURK|nr:RHS repeat protein [Ramlibacter terrae]
MAYDSEKKVLELKSTDREGIVTRLAYDALGNLTQRTEAAGRVEERTTRYEYDAAGRQVRVVFPKVGVYDPTEDNLLDESGVHKRTEDQAQLETRTFYDTFGNAVAGVDVGGGVSQKAYDAQGRLVYDVDAMGYVTGYKHDAFGQVIRLARYAGAIEIPASVDAASDAASATELAAAVKAENNSRDRILLSTYDRAGRMVETVEPTVYVYQHELEGGGRADTVGKTVRQVYNTFGDLVQVVTPGASATPPRPPRTTTTAPDAGWRRSMRSATSRETRSTPSATCSVPPNTPTRWRKAGAAVITAASRRHRRTTAGPNTSMTA